MSLMANQNFHYSVLPLDLWLGCFQDGKSGYIQSYLVLGSALFGF
jgi:hypothetical protein